MCLGHRFVQSSSESASPARPIRRTLKCFLSILLLGILASLAPRTAAAAQPEGEHTLTVANNENFAITITLEEPLERGGGLTTLGTVSPRQIAYFTVISRQGSGILFYVNGGGHNSGMSAAANGDGDYYFEW
jgi:hypothetical protein